MRNLLACLLLVALAGVISGQTTRATRNPPVRTTVRAAPPTRQQGGQTPNARPTPSRSTARVPPPTRQAGGNTPGRPTPSRATPGAPTPTRQSGGNPAIPTRTTPPAGGPTSPTRTPAPIVTGPTGPQFPQRPDEIATSPGNPNVPTAPTANPNLPNGRTTTRPPRVGAIGIPDSRCPAVQDPRNPTQLPHASNCERFYKCDHGLAFEYQCPVGQHWNARRNYCDFPNLANCGGNNGPSIWDQPPWSPPNINSPWSPPNNQIPQFPQVPQRPDFQSPINIPMAPRK